MILLGFPNGSLQSLMPIHVPERERRGVKIFFLMKQHASTPVEILISWRDDALFKLQAFEKTLIAKKPNQVVVFYLVGLGRNGGR